MTATNAFYEPNQEMPLEVPVAPTLVRPLSPRESQIVRMLENGQTAKEIAFELGIAGATVRVLISRAVKKGGRAPRRR